MDLTDPSTKDEPYDYRFVKWLIKEKVSYLQMGYEIFSYCDICEQNVLKFYTSE